VRRLSRSTLRGDATDVAPFLLNKLLVHDECIGRIIEVEAYREDDPASHSHRGRTERNSVMFGPPGRLYVYFTYGMHYCSNVVAGAEGEGAAVLLRAIAPIGGLDIMRERRGGRPRLADGPAKLCQAFAIGPEHTGVDLCRGAGDAPAIDVSRIGVYDDGTPPPHEPLVGPRVGISRAVDRPWRWRVP
jgi:DNA-3-methyladenine glycosylase